MNPDGVAGPTAGRLEAGLPYERHIDGLRGAAIASVVIFHAFPELLPGGYVGVDVFFVISGYLISLILFRTFATPDVHWTSAFAGFYIRRIRRLVPALALVLLGTLALGYVLLVPTEYERLAEQVIAGAGFYQNLLLAQQVGYFGPAAVATPLLHLWSLAVEEQFYLLWPLVVWVAIRRRLRILPIAAFLGTLSLAWAVLRPPGLNDGAFFLPQMRLWEILLGAGCAALPGPALATGRSRRQELMAISGLLLVGGGIAFAGRFPGVPNVWSLVPTGGTALLLLAGPAAKLNVRLLAHPALVALGLISYPLYLWHWPLLSFIQIGAASSLTTSYRLAIIGTALVLATVTFFLVERPIRRRPARARLAGRLVATLAAISGIAAVIRFTQGFPTRFPPLIGAIGSFHYDGAAATRAGTYFLMEGQDETSFPRDPAELVAGRPTLYLWGDSHAASLYPGVRRSYGHDWNIMQRTAAKTPPFLPDAFNPGNARQIAQFVFNSIARDRPTIVVLDANWPIYDWRKVGDTISALKRVGVPQVFVVGPVPRWKPSLPQALFNYARLHPGAPVPDQLPMADSAAFALLDAELGRLCRSQGATYLSAADALAGSSGFRVRMGDTPEQLLSFDDGHITAKAAEYLMARMPHFQP